MAGDGRDGALAAHFQAKRRLPAGEAPGRQEAGGASSKAASFCFNFDLQDAGTHDTSAPTKTKKSKKKKKKKKTKKTADGGPTDDAKIARSTAVEGTAADHRDETTAVPPSTGAGSSSSTFLKLRKATGSESEVARMQLRYGQGRRNPAATAQRARRRLEAAASGSGPAQSFSFNFEGPDK